MSELLDDLIRARIERGQAVAADFRGCTEQEVASLESRTNIQLPGLFKHYLRKMGWSAGGMIKGSDVRYGCLHLLTGEVREETQPRNIHLPADAFAFYAHQGYDYMYFLQSDDPYDPKVYRYHTDWDQPRLVFAAFSDYLRWLFETLMEIPPDRLPDDTE